jgi:hypothetical protein
MTRRLSLAFATILMLACGQSQAVPCGPWGTTGGIYQATACQNGGLGDANDSLADLNGGNFFGHNDWLLLTRTSDENDNGNYFWEVSYHVANDGVTGRTGAFILGAEIWRYFQDIAVVLKDGGSFTNSRIKWSAYLLPHEQYGTYNWSYDGDHKQISHLSLYARLRPVSEPASLALVASGLAAMGLVLKRRERARPRA